MPQTEKTFSREEGLTLNLPSDFYDFVAQSEKGKIEDLLRLYYLRKASGQLTPEIMEKKLLIKNYLENPDFFKIIVDETSKNVESELEARRIILLCSLGGSLVQNCQTASYNLLVNDDSGKGKDYVVSNTLDILPKEKYIKRTRISPAVLTYWHQNEPEWTWDGKVLYLEDISELVLNSDVFKVMQSSGSHATIVINQKAVDISISGKPISVTTTAKSEPNPELIRRNLILQLSLDESQTKKIMERSALNAVNGNSPSYDLDITRSLALLQRIKVKIPFADKMPQHFPHTNVLMRTNFPRFLDFIKASTAIFQYQRKKDKEGFYISELKDYDLARECFQIVSGNKEMRQFPLNQKKILQIFQTEPKLKVSASQLMPLTKGAIKSLITCQNHLHSLVEAGVLVASLDKDVWNRDIEVFSLAGTDSENKFIIPSSEVFAKTPDNERGVLDTLGNLGKKDGQDYKEVIPSFEIIAKVPKVPIIPEIPKTPKVPNNNNNNNNKEENKQSYCGKEFIESGNTYLCGQLWKGEQRKVCLSCNKTLSTNTSQQAHHGNSAINPLSQQIKGVSIPETPKEQMNFKEAFPHE